MAQPANRPSRPARESSAGVIRTPSYQTRVFFCGTTGSGKTVLASQMLAPYPSAVVLDVKWDFPIPWEHYTVVDKPPGIGFLNSLKWRFGSRHIVYRPRPPYDSGQWISHCLERMFDRGRRARGADPFVLYVDEGAWVGYSGAWNALARLVITGRALNIGVWIGSQRPFRVPREIKSQAGLWLIFYLSALEDRQEVVKHLGGKVTEEQFEQTTKAYQFWASERGPGGRWEHRLMAPVRLNHAPNGVAKEGRE